MPRRNSLTGRLLRHLLLISVASCVLNVFSRGWDDWDEKKLPEPKAEPEPATDAAPAPKRKRRICSALARLEAAVRLVDDVGPAAAADDAAVPVARFERLQAVANLHGRAPASFFQSRVVGLV